MEKAKAYIKSSLGASKPASPSLEKPCAPTDDVRVCFVCGGAGFSDSYNVRVKPDTQSSEPYFPFLGAHAPPTGYRAEGDEEGTVRCCCVCYTFLRQQWEQYDRENKPHSQRFYWMKRLDGKPFIGADMSFQGEYAAQVLGLSGEPAPPSPRPASRALFSETPATTPAANDKENHTTKFNNVNQRYNNNTGGEEEGVLDLRARDPSVISVGSQHSGASEPAGYLDAVRSTVSVYSGNSNSSSDRDILDLSMPDKNSMTEVCYVCGDEYKRGTLYNLHTKEPKDKTNKQPYFPIFGEQHPRPPRSRPKDAMGTVRACAACHHHLLQQWNTYHVQDDAGELHGITQPTVSRICARVARAIAAKAPLFIKMPATLQEEQRIMAKFQSIKNFPGVIGAIDCTHIKIRKTGGEQAQYYINRKGQYSLNVQAVCDADLKILDIVARWRGSTHDSRIFSESRLKERFENGDFRGRLLGDSGYPLLPYLFTPLLNPRSASEERYNEAQIGTRNTIERCFGVWKQKFQCLLVGLPVKFYNCKPVIVALAVLHNIAVDMNDTDTIPDDDNVDVETTNEEQAQQQSQNRMADVVPSMTRRRCQQILQSFIQQNF